MSSMKDPKVEKSYMFVRLNDSAIEHARYIRSADGSAVVLYSEFAQVHERHPDAWRNALAELDVGGFVELRDAKDSGLIPQDWQPAATTLAAVAAEPGPNNSFKPNPLRGSA